MKPVIIAVIIVILVVAIGALMVTPEKEIVSDIDEPIINNFEECIAAGNPAMESYPRQCRTEDGKHFVEIIEEKPTVCTLQWEPMCGVDGETYGNLCMLNASDVKLDYEGECVAP